MSKILVIHNIKWAHYKSLLFEALHQACGSRHDFHVLQLAETEHDRKGMERNDNFYEFPETVLNSGAIEEISTLRKFFQIVRFIHKFKPNVVNIHGWGMDFSLTLSLIYCWIIRKKIVISVESTLNESQKSGPKWWLKKIFVRMASGFVTFGRSSSDFVLALGAKPEQIICERAAVVDQNRLRSTFENAKPTNNQNFIYVGRLSEEKNIEFLVEAFNKSKKEGWGLIILGAGPLTNKFKNLPDVQLLSGVKWFEVPSILAQAQVLVLPSLREPWGLVVNEALACGLAVAVSSACGCFPDLVAESCVFNPNNQAELIRILERFMDDSDFLNAQKNEGKRRIEKFEVGEVAKEIIEKIYA